MFHCNKDGPPPPYDEDNGQLPPPYHQAVDGPPPYDDIDDDKEPDEEVKSPHEVLECKGLVCRYMFEDGLIRRPNPPNNRGYCRTCRQLYNSRSQSYCRTCKEVVQCCDKEGGCDNPCSNCCYNSRL